MVVLLGTFGVVPGGAELFGILRLLRLFTALSFLTDKLPALRMVVATASRATSSIAYVGLLLLAVYFQVRCRCIAVTLLLCAGVLVRRTVNSAGIHATPRHSLRRHP